VRRLGEWASSEWASRGNVIHKHTTVEFSRSSFASEVVFGCVGTCCMQCLFCPCTVARFWHSCALQHDRASGSIPNHPGLVTAPPFLQTIAVVGEVEVAIALGRDASRAPTSGREDEGGRVTAPKSPVWDVSGHNRL